jgi:hypothetical protein
MWSRVARHKRLFAEKWPTLRGRLALVVRVGTLIWLVGHFSLTALYVMPDNPLSESLQPLSRATIGRYFEQNWALFAPNPRESNLALLARPLTPAEVAALPESGWPGDGWYDLSTPMWERFQYNRFTPDERLTRPQAEAIVAYLRALDDLEPLKQACADGSAPACAYYEQRARSALAEPGQVLAKVASAYCQKALDGCPAASHVALRVRETRPVPWERRHEGTPVVLEFDLDVYPVDGNVAADHLPLLARPARPLVRPRAGAPVAAADISGAGGLQ